MQELKAKQQSPFTLDKAWLSQQRPALLLTQDACRACDVDSSLVAQVCPLATCTTLYLSLCLLVACMLAVWVGQSPLYALCCFVVDLGS